MVVESYLREEFLSPIIEGEDLNEFNKLVEELGLSCGNKIDETKSQVPFDKMDYTMIRAFQVLCPDSKELDKYNYSIPLEALRLVKLCQHEKYFDSIEVWYTEVDPDPFLIGRLYKTQKDREQGYNWGKEYYLISRWGPESKSIPDLINDARVKIEANLKASYVALQLAGEQGLKHLDIAVEKFLTKKNTSIAYPSVNNNASEYSDGLPF